MLREDSWLSLQSGLEVVVASSSPEKLLGVRDGFLRFLREGLHSRASVTVATGWKDSRSEPVPTSDEEALRMAREKIHHLRDSRDVYCDCYVASEGGLCTVSVEGEDHFFARTWTVVAGLGGEAWGASGSIQIPGLVFERAGGGWPAYVPGTRRGGGMMGSITRGIESRRTAVADSACHALATLVFQGMGAGPV